MEDSPSSPVTMDPNMKQPESDNPSGKLNPPSNFTPAPEQPKQSSIPNPNSYPNPNPNPNLNQTPAPASLPLPPVQSYSLSPVPPSVPVSYRPIPIPTAPHFSPVQNYQNPAMQPPGVGVSGGVGVTVPPSVMHYPVVPGQALNIGLRPYAPMPNGFGGVPAPAPVS